MEVKLTGQGILQYVMVFCVVRSYANTNVLLQVVQHATLLRIDDLYSFSLVALRALK